MMFKRPWLRTAQMTLGGAVLLQVTACFGPDPQLFFTSTIANAVVFNVINLLFNTLSAGLGAA